MSDAQDRGERQGEERGQRPPERKLAEWVTMGVSAALVLGVAGFLVHQVTLERTPFVAVEVRPLLEEAREEQGRYILPVEVKNRGHHTLQDFEGQVVYRSPEGERETRTFKIDYLGEQSEQKVYFYFERPPREISVEARPHSYILE